MNNGAQAQEECQEWKGRGLNLATSEAGQRTVLPAEGRPAKVSPRKARQVAAGAFTFRGKCLLMAVFCFTWAISAYADSSSPSAKELAQRVDRHYNSLHSLKAGFSETYQGLGTDRTESGTLLLLKPGRMKWDYSSPPGKIFVLDGKYAWSYTRGDAQAERIPAKELNDLRSPLRYLLGHAELGRELDNLKVAPAANGQFTLTGIPKGM
jgi:outer membrane lipoprotein carrier protein